MGFLTSIFCNNVCKYVTLHLRENGGIILSKEIVDFDDLLEEYRSIWNNRLLVKGEKSSEEILIEAIKRELLDENTHPRIRKNRYEKYFSAMKRVIDSTVSTEAKLTIIKIHNEIMEKLS
jgi:hypothetical protein